MHFMSRVQSSLLQNYMDGVVKNIVINFKLIDIPGEGESIPCSI